jgi:hypothetical protein
MSESNGRAVPLIGAITIPAAIVLGLWGARTTGSWIHWRDAVGSIGLTLLAVALGWWLSGRVTQESTRRGLAALIAGIWIPLHGSLRLAMTALVHDAFRSAWVVPTLWTLWCALAIWIVLKAKVRVEFASRFAAGAGVMLFLAQANALRPEPVPEAPPRVVTARSDVPNIYLLVVDKLTSGAWMQHTYGVDISAYEDSLRALGFVVPSRARANYSHPHLALASFLNWRYLDAAVDGAGDMPWGQTQKLVRNARLWTMARANGYRVVTFPGWYPTTQRIDSAEVLARVIRPTPAGFADTWLVNSPIADLVSGICPRVECGTTRPPFPGETIEELEWKLSTFASMADSAAPTLTFLHLLLTHEPYLFAENCAPMKAWWPKSDQGEAFDSIGVSYGRQVQCAMPMLLGAVREILAREKVPPVIIIQGDHGHGRLFVDVNAALTLEYDEMSPAQLGERMSVFGAYLLPNGAASVPDNISMVNVMRVVARELWADSSRTLPDSVFYSSYQSGFSFRRVPMALLDAPFAAGARGLRDR